MTWISLNDLKPGDLVSGWASSDRCRERIYAEVIRLVVSARRVNGINNITMLRCDRFVGHWRLVHQGDHGLSAYDTCYYVVARGNGT